MPGLVDTVRDNEADNSNNFQVLTEEIVNGRADAGTFCITSRTICQGERDRLPSLLQEKYTADVNDLTEEWYSQNIDFLGIDYLIPSW